MVILLGRKSKMWEKRGTPLCSKILEGQFPFDSNRWSYGRMIIETLIKGGECV